MLKEIFKYHLYRFLKSIEHYDSLSKGRYKIKVSLQENHEYDKRLKKTDDFESLKIENQ